MSAVTETKNNNRTYKANAKTSSNHYITNHIGELRQHCLLKHKLVKHRHSCPGNITGIIALIS